MIELISSGGFIGRAAFQRRRLSPQEKLDYHQKGFLHIPALTPPSEINRIKEIMDRLYASKGLQFGDVRNPLRLAPELTHTHLYQSCCLIAKQLLGLTARYGCDRGLYKEPAGRHGSPWHQDAAFHGTYSLLQSLTFWIPLHDVEAENGCMQYIALERGQKLLPHRPFYPGDNFSLMTPYADTGLAVTVPVRAGGATIHGPMTLHAAHVNSADVIRRVWTISFRPWGRWGGIRPTRIAHILSVLVQRSVAATRLRGH
ncbi:MAG: phytanoyl-CoA dioxygenase family protein [Nitrospira sp.]